MLPLKLALETNIPDNFHRAQNTQTNNKTLEIKHNQDKILVKA